MDPLEVILALKVQLQDRIRGLESGVFTYNVDSHATFTRHAGKHEAYMDILYLIEDIEKRYSSE